MRVPDYEGSCWNREAAPVLRATIEVAARYGCDIRHARHVQSLVSRIFDQTRSLHEYRTRHGHLLEQAALLYDVGAFFAPRPSPDLTMYVIENSGLEGFSRSEVSEIATIARIGAGGGAGPTRRCTMRKRARLLGSILRMAIALDRARTASVLDVQVSARRDVLHFDVCAESYPRVEIEAARRHGRLFASLLNRDLEVSFESVIRWSAPRVPRT